MTILTNHIDQERDNKAKKEKFEKERQFESRLLPTPMVMHNFPLLASAKVVYKQPVKIGDYHHYLGEERETTCDTLKYTVHNDTGHPSHAQTTSKQKTSIAKQYSKPNQESESTQVSKNK